ncbi:MAG: hypothetical protein DRJ64_04365, partial [Thermoprotei archaeon]
RGNNKGLIHTHFYILLLILVMELSEIVLITVSFFVFTSTLFLACNIYRSTEEHSEASILHEINLLLNKTCSMMSPHSYCRVVIPVPYCSEARCSHIVILYKNDTGCSVRV